MALFDPVSENDMTALGTAFGDAVGKRLEAAIEKAVDRILEKLDTMEPSMKIALGKKE